MRWRCSGSESHAGSDSWRSVSSASAGITPNRFCRAKISSRSTSQPWSKRPRNGSLHSGATSRVGRAGRPVGKEWPVRRHGPLPVDPLDHAIGEIGAQVIVLGVFGSFDRRGAVIQTRVVLVGFTPHESVELFEAHPSGPPIERSGRADFPYRSVVPFTESRCAVAVLSQRLGYGRRRFRDDAVVAVVAGGKLCDGSGVDDVVVAAGQQRGPGGRTQRRGVETVVPQPFLGQRVTGRGFNRPTKCCGGAEADVVEQHDHHVRRPLRGPDGGDGRHLRLGDRLAGMAAGRCIRQR